MTSEQENRKNQHVSIAESYYGSQGTSPFADLRFVHHNFPNLAVDQVDISSQVGDLHFPAPFYINAMTGGSEWTAKINRRLAKVAHHTQIPMAVGSQSVAIRQPELAETFSVVREENPDGLVFANIGANHDANAGLKAIDILQADALQVHINAPQELVMPEGDRDFTDWPQHFKNFLDRVDLPVIFKEVGFGFSQQSIHLLKDLGAQYIDLGGRGGTNFAQIENFRRKDFKLDDLLTWGQTTPEALMEAQEFISSITILASGGVKTGLDIVKSLALGAKAVGLAGEFLHVLLKDGDQALVDRIEGLKEEIRLIYTLLGAQSTSDLVHTDLIVSGDLKDYCEARQIDVPTFAQRFSYN